MDAANLRLPRVGENGIGELDLRRGERVGCRRRFEIGRRIIARIETDAVHLREIGDRRLGALVGRAMAHPQRLVVARLVELLDAVAIGLVGNDPVELLAGDDVVQLVGDGIVGIGLDGRRRRNGRGFGRLGGRARRVRFAVFGCILGSIPRRVGGRRLRGRIGLFAAACGTG